MVMGWMSEGVDGSGSNSGIRVRVKLGSIGMRTKLKFDVRKKL